MSSLANLQRALQASVLHGDGTPAVIDAIVTSPAADATQRLGIYLHAYRARLLEVLGNDHPGLRSMTGSETFERLGNAYIDATPSTQFNVRWYGGALARFLRGMPDEPSHLAFAAMAELEWAMGLAFDAEFQTIVEARAMAAIDAASWPTLGLRLQSSLQRFSLEFNAPEIRLAVDQGKPVPAVQAWHPPQAWIVWRKDSRVRYRRLDEDEAAAIDAIAAGASFAQVCELLCAYQPVDAVALRAAGLFRAWIDDQWVAALLQPDASVA